MFTASDVDMTAMAKLTDTKLRETLCDRFIAVADASGMQRIDFAKLHGISPSQLSNIACYRNMPTHAMVFRLVQHYGIPADFFYGRADFGLSLVPPKVGQTPRKQARAA
jgi:transcriptional regulator with XRE-family HTH domain